MGISIPSNDRIRTGRRSDAEERTFRNTLHRMVDCRLDDFINHLNQPTAFSRTHC